MKKIIILANLIILISLTACGSSKDNFQIITPAYEIPNTNPLPEEYRKLLPEGYEIPVKLPKGIEDAHLLVAWIYLYNQTDTISIQDDSVLSGRDLAMFVLNQQIQIRWGSDEICLGNSCAMRALCPAPDCGIGSEKERSIPVYISQRYQDSEAYPISRLAGSLSHELYHKTQPFGPVVSSLYEEFWAYYVAAQIEQSEWPIFDGYIPENHACLREWVHTNWQKTEFNMVDYPPSMTMQGDATGEVCVG